jgi:hypothetical protein
VEIDLANGNANDRPNVMRGNVSGISLAALVAAAAGAQSADQVNLNGRGVKVVIDITALAGTTPTLTVTIQGKDPVSGKYFTILASAALAAVATTVLTVYPGLVAAANVAANDVLPRDWRISYAIGGSAGQAVTATITASIIN